MVSIEKENIFQLREHYLSKVMQIASENPFYSALAIALELYTPIIEFPFTFSSLSLYQRCAISGLDFLNESISNSDVQRLLGQAAKIDTTPRPWVSDIFGVIAVRLLIDRMDDVSIDEQFHEWIRRFLPEQILSRRMNKYENDLASFVTNGVDAEFSTASIPLFLHYLGKVPISDHDETQSLIGVFMGEFRALSSLENSSALLAILVYVFDKIGREIPLAPPSGWSLNDLEGFLENVPVGLRRWTWELKARTPTSDAVKWFVQSEYHVQNILYMILGPIFVDVSDEVYLEPLGQKTPRIDLYLPSINTVIEVKYRKNSKKSFQAFISEIAEDASLYRSDPKYKDADIICFLWDHTRSTQEHTKFKEGVMKLEGISSCVVVSSPSTMD